MKIIAGTWRGRPLAPPPATGMRPTAIRLRQALFDVLQNGLGIVWPSITVADWCCGSGALGIEALSRGAAAVYFLDSDTAALQLVRRNLARLGAGTGWHVLAGDINRPPPAPSPAHLLFFDPPYAFDAWAECWPRLHAAGWWQAGSIIAAEHAAKRMIPSPPAAGLLRAPLQHGAGAISLWQVN